VNIIGMTKARSMRWVRYVACMGVTIYTGTQLIIVQLAGRSHLKGSGVDDRLILNWILENYIVKLLTKKTIEDMATMRNFEFIPDKVT
jgi:hypothetical protein